MFTLHILDSVTSIIISTTTILLILLKFVFIPFFEKVRKFFANIRYLTKTVAEIKDQISCDGKSLKDELVQINTKQQNFTIEIQNLSDLVHHVNDLANVADGKCMSILEKFEYAVYECDIKTGDLIWSNRAAQKLYNQTDLQMLGTGWMRYLHSDDMQSVRQLYMEALHNMIPYRARYRIAYNNQCIYVESKADVIRNSAGIPITIYGTTEILRIE